MIATGPLLTCRLSRRGLLSAMATAAAVAPLAVKAQTPAADWPGVRGTDKYESPSFGYTLSWGAPWQMPTDEPAATSGDGVDTFVLHHEFRGPGENRLQFTGESGGDDPKARAQQMRAMAEDEGNLILKEGTTDNAYAVMYTNPNDFSITITVMEYRYLVDRDCHVNVKVQGGIVAFGDVYTSLQEVVKLNMSSPFQVIPMPLILMAFDAFREPQATPESAATPA